MLLVAYLNLVFSISAVIFCDWSVFKQSNIETCRLYDVVFLSRKKIRQTSYSIIVEVPFFGTKTNSLGVFCFKNI